MELLEDNKSAVGLAVVGLSTLAFYVVGKIIENRCTPKCVQKNKDTCWKWKNISVSLVHAIITSIWAVLCFYSNPKMAEDLISTHSLFSRCLVAVSVAQKMASTIELGYECSIKDCGWQGKRKYAADHFVKKHSTLDEAPFSCEACSFKCGSTTNLDEHLGKSKHQKAMKTWSGGEAVKRKGNEQELLERFVVMSLKASRKLWRDKQDEKDREGVKSALQALARADVDQDQIDAIKKAMGNVGLPTEVATKKRKTKSATKPSRESPSRVIEEETPSPETLSPKSSVVVSPPKKPPAETATTEASPTAVTVSSPEKPTSEAVVTVAPLPKTSVVSCPEKPLAEAILPKVRSTVVALPQKPSSEVLSSPEGSKTPVSSLETPLKVASSSKISSTVASPTMPSITAAVPSTKGEAQLEVYAPSIDLGLESESLLDFEEEDSVKEEDSRVVIEQPLPDTPQPCLQPEVASAIHGLIREVIESNHNFLEGITKLDKQTADYSKLQTEQRELVREVQKLNDNMKTLNRRLDILERYDRHLTAFSDLFTKNMRSLELATLCKVSPSAEVDPTSSMDYHKQSKEFNSEWSKQQHDTEDNLRQRKHSHPYHHSVIDTSSPNRPSVRDRLREYAPPREISRGRRRPYQYRGTYRGLNHY